MNRSLLVIALAASMLALTACGNDKTIDGKNYETFGVFNQESQKDPKILYEVSAGSVIWAIILSETIIVPVYVIGWDLWQPIKTK
jgi:hypothetical protein